MPAKREAAHAILADLVARFPDAPALTLAKRAYREHPELWHSLETCRAAFRRAFGTIGKHHRDHSTNKRYYRPPRQPGDWRKWIPEAINQLAGWGAVRIPGPHRILILSDIHIPFHSVEAVSLALDYGLQNKTTLVLLNGDIADHYNQSEYVKDPKLRDTPGEVRAVKKFLAGIRKRFPKARIILKHGNHEERWENYLRLKAPDLLGIPDFDWHNVMGLDEQRIELVRDKKPIQVGALNVIHGHEYRFQIANPVNPARGLFLRAKAHAICGHFHQSSHHSDGTLEQKIITCWSTGCLCDLHPGYRPLNNWNHGFAFVVIDRDGGFHVDNLRIIDGKVW